MPHFPLSCNLVSETIFLNCLFLKIFEYSRKEVYSDKKQSNFYQFYVLFWLKDGIFFVNFLVIFFKNCFQYFLSIVHKKFEQLSSRSENYPFQGSALGCARESRWNFLFDHSQWIQEDLPVLLEGDLNRFTVRRIPAEFPSTNPLDSHFHPNISHFVLLSAVASQSWIRVVNLSDRTSNWVIPDSDFEYWEPMDSCGICEMVQRRWKATKCHFHIIQ